MIEDKRQNAYTVLGVGILLGIPLGILSRINHPTANILYWVVFFVVAPIWVLGCALYAEAKGYHWAWGFLGVTFFLGYFILLCFPDHCPDGYPRRRKRLRTQHRKVDDFRRPRNRRDDDEDDLDPAPRRKRRRDDDELDSATRPKRRRMDDF